ncbi:MAG: hypothetical protein QXQ70_08700 [Candidatus Caldarchaeum sp.]
MRHTKNSSKTMSGARGDRAIVCKGCDVFSPISATSKLYINPSKIIVEPEVEDRQYPIAGEIPVAGVDEIISIPKQLDSMAGSGFRAGESSGKPLPSFFKDNPWLDILSQKRSQPD